MKVSHYREKSVVPLLKKWKSSCVRLDNDFEFVEPVYNTKSTLCKLLGSWIKDEQLHSAFVENLLKFAEVARQANRNQVILVICTSSTITVHSVRL